MKPTALVVDASPGYRQSLVTRLESLGLSVTQVAAAEELLPHRGRRWRLVVSDWAIPGMMGCELVEALKPNHQPVFINADAETAELSQVAWGLGVRGVFHKSRRLDLMKALRDELADDNKDGTDIMPAIPATQPMRFLVVEDSPTIRGYLRRCLETAFPGCDISECADGKTALYELMVRKIHLIVTDLQMPGMDGESLLMVLKKNPVLAKKPVLVFSGAVTENLRRQHATTPMLTILPKPALPAQVAASVRELLERAN